MRDSYVGDIGDFAKYGLLQTLARGRRLEVAWCLRTDSDPSGSNDGRHTDYLMRPEEWKHLDPELFGGLGKLVRDGTRTVAAVAGSGLPGNATFAGEPLDVSRVSPRTAKDDGGSGSSRPGTCSGTATSCSPIQTVASIRMTASGTGGGKAQSGSRYPRH